MDLQAILTNGDEPWEGRSPCPNCFAQMCLTEKQQCYLNLIDLKFTDKAVRYNNLKVSLIESHGYSLLMQSIGYSEYSVYFEFLKCSPAFHRMGLPFKY